MKRVMIIWHQYQCHILDPTFTMKGEISMKNQRTLLSGNTNP